MNLKTVTIADLTPHPDNPNTHPSKQITSLAQSLETFEQVKNVVVWNGRILAGHGLVKAATKSGRLTLEAQDVSHWPEAKATAFMLADIRLPGMAIIDEGVLAETLRAIDKPLDIPGFDEDFLKGLPGFEPEPPPDPGPQIDKAAELQEKWGTALGQVWTLGEHRLACGDCTDKGVVKGVMGGERADCLIADPPYNVAYNDRSKDGNRGQVPLERFKPNQKHNTKKVVNDSTPGFSKIFFEALNRLPKAENWNGYIFCASQSLLDFSLICDDLNIKRHIPLVWVKDIAVPSFLFYRTRHEFIMLIGNGVVTMGTKSSNERWFGGTTETTVLEFPAIQSASSVDDNGNLWFSGGSKNLNLHPNQKPVALLERIIKNSTQENESIYDPFLGSGTTLIAAHQLDRRCRGIEIDPGYVAVALERFHQATQIEPELTK